MQWLVVQECSPGLRQTVFGLKEKDQEFQEQLSEEREKLARLLPAEFAGRIVYGTEGNREIAALDRADMTITAVVGAESTTRLPPGVVEMIQAYMS